MVFGFRRKIQYSILSTSFVLPIVGWLLIRTRGDNWVWRPRRLQELCEVPLN